MEGERVVRRRNEEGLQQCVVVKAEAYLLGRDEEEPEPPIAGSESGAQEPPAQNGLIHTYFTDSD